MKMRSQLFLILGLLLMTLSIFNHTTVYASYNINFSIDSDSLPPALQDIIKSIAGIQRVVVSGTFTGQKRTDWFFSGNLIVETTHGTAFNGALNIRYKDGIVDWSLKFGSGIKIKIWSLGTKRFDVTFKKIPFIKHIDVGADVFLEFGGTGGLTNGVGQADVYIGLSAHAVLGFFKEKAITSDASIDAHVNGKIHLVLSYDGKYLRAGWYPEIGARAVIRVGKWFSWNWGDTWRPEKIPWPLGEWDLSSGTTVKIRTADSYEDIPGAVINSSDGGGSTNSFVSDAPNVLSLALDVGYVIMQTDGTDYVYPIYGSASTGSHDYDFFKAKLVPKSDIVVYLKPEVADYDLYIYSPLGDLYAESRLGGDSVDTVIIPKTVLESWNNTIIIGVQHFAGDGVYVVTFGYLSEERPIYHPPVAMQGDITGDGSIGPHYNNPSSPAWREILVELTAGTQYRFTLSWVGDADLDLYLYSPGKAPSQDGTGNDFIKSSASINNPEEIIYTPMTSGVWVLGIDMYSQQGTANFILTVEILSGSSETNNNVYVPPVIINGTIEGSTSGPHINDPDSPSWIEYQVSLEEGVTYVFKLCWDSRADLDLYLYAPGTAPSQDGAGDDYVAASNSAFQRPEVIVYTPNASGTWVIGVDHYSLDDSTDFVLEISIQQNNSNISNIITGSVSADGIGSHYNDYNSPAWSEHQIYLEAGKKYRVVLDWDSFADLDLYLYAPGTAPSQDGTGDDYYERSFTSKMPEVIEFAADVSGYWVVAVDKYSGEGLTRYKITIDEIPLNSTGIVKFVGEVRGIGTSGPHYGEPSAWSEHGVYLVGGQRYRITLSWNGSSDLDLYVYAPNSSPLVDGTGGDYVVRAYSTAKPEIVEFIANVSGVWIVAVDHYSKSGSASYEIRVETIGDIYRSVVSGSTVGLPKTNYNAAVDSDLDGIPDNIEEMIPLMDAKNPLLPAIYPPLVAIFVAALIMRKTNRRAQRSK